MAFRNGKSACTLCSTGTTPPGGTGDFPVQASADCPASVVVDDLVYVTGPVVAGIIQVAKVDVTDRAKMPAYGIVVSKSTTTRCIIQTLGHFVTGVVLTPGQPVYVGTDGQPASSIPSLGSSPSIAVTQIVGYAWDSSSMFLNFGDFSLIIANAS
jgi:hypothetical protein